MGEDAVGPWAPPEWSGYPHAAWPTGPWWAPVPARWVLPVVPAPLAPPQWYPDPAGRHDLRRWDREWTNEVLDGRRPGRDPAPEGLEAVSGAEWDLGALTRGEQAAILEALGEEHVVIDWDGRTVVVDAVDGDLVEAVVRGACSDVVFGPRPPDSVLDDGEQGGTGAWTGWYCKIDVRHLRRLDIDAAVQALAEAQVMYGNDGAFLTVAVEDAHIAWEIVDTLAG